EPRVVLTEPPASEKPARPTAQPKETRVPSRILVPALIAAIVVAAIAGVWHYFGRNYLEARQEAQQAAAEAQQPAAPQPAGVPLGYSVAIEAHPNLPAAVARTEALSEAEPGMGFYIAPILVDSVLYYRVLA